MRFFLFIILTTTLALDQITKAWARWVFSLPGGEPDYYRAFEVLGEWVRFRLVYNHGAAFGMKPQNLLPFLHPTFFYAVFSLIAMGILAVYYKKFQPGEIWGRIGIALILSGALGNLIDRLWLHKVTDFIDVGIPGIAWRWPTFNIADSCVCIGVGILMALPWLSPDSTKSSSESEGAATALPHG
jgi:signal peptidase II